jgi:hypothetical protein
LLRRIGVVVALSSVLFIGSSCGDSSASSDTAGLRLDLIDEALDAVEQEAGSD